MIDRQVNFTNAIAFISSGQVWYVQFCSILSFFNTLNLCYIDCDRYAAIVCVSFSKYNKNSCLFTCGITGLFFFEWNYILYKHCVEITKKMHLLNKCSCYMLVSFLLFFNESQYKHVHVNKIEKENKFNYG